MTWIIIVLVLLVAFGPVFWLLPSKRDRRLSALRQAARVAGLTVELKRLPKLNPEPEERVSAGGKIREPVIDCAAYAWNMTRKLRILPELRLLRGSHGTSALPGWVYDPGRTPRQDHLEALLNVLASFTQSLREDVIAVEVGERQLECYWQESPGSEVELVTSMAAQLQRLECDLNNLEKGLEEDYLDPDS